MEISRDWNPIFSFKEERIQKNDASNLIILVPVRRAFAVFLDTATHLYQ